MFLGAGIVADRSMADMACGFHDMLAQSQCWFHYRNLLLLRTGDILDVAAAQGNYTVALAELGYDVTWNDIREDLAGYVRLKLEHGRIDFAPGNVFELSFPAPFDGLLIRNH
jgi:2-polyprenyl-3-methyl-5-hydroxy-6-metoxy-1,4-benzoquinol methylase